MLVVLMSILPLFLMMGIGWLVGKKNIVDVNGSKGLTGILVKVALPCAVINSLMMESSAEFLVSVSKAFGIIFMITAVMILISFRMFRKAPPERRGVLQMGCVYGNSAFVGIALVQAVLGEEAVIYATLIMIIETVLMLIHAPLAMSGEGKMDMKKAFLNPGVLAFAAGLIRMLFSISLPEPVLSVITQLGRMNAPLAMLIVGIEMSRADMSTVFTQPALYVCAAVKLVIQPVILLAVLWPFHLPAVMYSAIVICKGTPQAAVLGVFAADNGQDAGFASQLIALTSLLQLATLPAVSVLSRIVAGI